MWIVFICQPQQYDLMHTFLFCQLFVIRTFKIEPIVFRKTQPTNDMCGENVNENKGLCVHGSIGYF